MGLPEHGLTCEAFEVGESLYVVVDDLPSRQATDALVAVAHWAQLEAGLRSADGCMLSFPSFEGDEEVLRELQVPNGSYFAERVCLDLGCAGLGSYEDTAAACSARTVRVK